MNLIKTNKNFLHVFSEKNNAFENKQQYELNSVRIKRVSEESDYISHLLLNIIFLIIPHIQVFHNTRDFNDSFSDKFRINCFLAKNCRDTLIVFDINLKVIKDFKL